MFCGVPLGVLGAVLGGVRTGGGFWVAGSRFRRSGARSGRSMGAAGAGVVATCPALGSGGAFWGWVAVLISATENRTRAGRSVLGGAFWGFPFNN